MIKKRIFHSLILLIIPAALLSQSKSDTLINIFSPSIFIQQDTLLRIKNLNPYVNLHVDSTLKYPLIINKDLAKYYWFLKNPPVGLKINKDNGELTFKAEKSYFLSGRLKYDYEYKVALSVQNLDNPQERVDTNFVLLFYNTEIIPSKIKPTVTNTLFIEEGDTVSFKLQCDNGNFPIEEITYFSNYPIKSITKVTRCNDDFTWCAPFDFVKETDKDKQKKLEIYFIGTNKFNNRDTAVINIMVKENINYPEQAIEFEKLKVEIEHYVIQLKSSFRLVDKKIKKTKGTRTSFDLASASTALGGTVFSSLPGSSQQTTGKILPSVGVALVPVKEATAPNSNADQNTATLIRSSIKRLEYLLADNTLFGEKDQDILNKSRKLKDELKQSQIQLIDIPIAEENRSIKELDDYFNNPKVNKKYRVKRNN
ncbi:MAG: hypothetical protein H7320_04350 [Ferruginibacter sp.]|nr:hypothetical protein [Ferruginibacter sp.]